MHDHTWTEYAPTGSIHDLTWTEQAHTCMCYDHTWLEHVHTCKVADKPELKKCILKALISAERFFNPLFKAKLTKNVEIKNQEDYEK